MLIGILADDRQYLMISRPKWSALQEDFSDIPAPHWLTNGLLLIPV